MTYDGAVSIRWDTSVERLVIKNSEGEEFALTYNEGVNLYRLMNRTISLKNKILLVLFGNKRFGKMIQ